MARITEVLLVLLFLLDIYSQACNDCDCCNGENACDEDKKCTNGCISGYWGDKCSESCPENCKTCESNIACTECHPGYHGSLCAFKCGKGCMNNTCLQSGKCTCKSSDFTGRYCSSCSSSIKYGDECNYTCPPHCGACKSQTECSWCKNFFTYGSYCQFICAFGCVTGTCNEDGSCHTGCKPGYWGDKCIESCPENCKTCVSNIECTECKHGYNGNQCVFECGKGCMNNTCLQSGECTCKSNDFKGRYCSLCSSPSNYGNECNYPCPPNCGACKSQTECSWCKAFFTYGSYCQFTCSVGCIGVTCNKNGSCQKGCKPGFTGNKCDFCVSGKYGQNCDLDCPSNCTSCLSNSNCTECELGFYGDTCTNVCQPGCHGECSSANGKCMECKQGFYGDFCNNTKTCKDGFYGNYCSKPCKIVDNRCQKCLTNESGVYGGCVKCLSGYYLNIPFGINHSLCISCSKDCKDNACDTTGFCTYGCSLGKWGVKCKYDCLNNCLECNQINGKCIRCKHGKYSEDCSEVCSPNCSSIFTDQICEFNTGECNNGCISNRKYGNFCEHRCSEACNNRTCKWKTGQCSYGCVENYHGSYCENECASTCKPVDKKRLCNDSNGHCISGCENGFHGGMCTSKCSEKCKNKTCDRLTAECLYGCIDGYDGLQCTQELRQIQQESITTGELVGIVFGSVLIGVLIGGVLTLVFVMWKRRKREESDDHTDVNYENNISVTYEDLKARDEKTYSQINADRHISPQTAEYVNC